MAFYHWYSNRVTVQSHPVVSRTRQSVTDFLDRSTDTSIIDNFRLDKVGIHHFAEKIRKHELIERKTQSGLPVETQLMVALSFYSSGNSLRSLRSTADLKLSLGSVENCVKNVSVALSSLASEYITNSWETSSIVATKQGFLDYGGFPGCLGAIDGTKIKIRAPSVDEDAYVGRHPGHYINCQAICDHRLKFLEASVRWPASVHDSTIWEHCSFREELGLFLASKPSDYQGWLIGDSGYAQREEMMIPYLEPDSTAKVKYNGRHKKSRCVIERAFGALKSRFRCLCKESGGALMFAPDMACAIIVSCMVLHNYCIERNFPMTTSEHVKKSIELENIANVSIRPPPTISQSDKTLSIRGILARNKLMVTHFSCKKRVRQ